MRHIKPYTDHLNEQEGQAKDIYDLWVVYYIDIAGGGDIHLVGAWEDHEEARRASDERSKESWVPMMTVCQLRDAEVRVSPWVGREGYESLMEQLEALDGLPDWAVQQFETDATMQQIRRRKRSRGAFGRF